MRAPVRRFATSLGGAILILAAILWLRPRLSERWHAIAPRGGENFTMPVLATPHYFQRDPQWSEEQIGGSDERIGRVGCTLCSVAMGLDHFGIKLTPKELNDFLKANEGYNLRGWLRWDSIRKVSKGRLSVEFAQHPTLGLIDSSLRSNRPVIAKVYIDEVIPHWVLIVGKEGNEFLMRDPLAPHGEVRPISTYKSKIHALRILQKTQLAE